MCSDHEFDDEYDDRDLVICPNCMGSGEVNCYCGGDLCICDNYGDAPCPVCHGDGEVSEERSARYFDNQRKNWDAIQKIMGSKPE